MRTRRSSSSNGRIALVGAVVVGVLMLAACDPEPDALVVGRDGTTSETAGASCWGIKQEFPASTDGTYWLYTPSMDRPEPFHCDMTTDGGGWVLVGRGRDGWTFHPNGQGTPEAVRRDVDGPAAFAPAALPKDTIDELLDRNKLSAEPDGIRLERAISVDGSTRQDYRFHSRADEWTWSFDAGQILNSIAIDGTVYRGGNTLDTGAHAPGEQTNDLYRVNDTRRLTTAASVQNDDRKGFATFAPGKGSSDPSSYFWGPTYAAWRDSPRWPLPFTTIWLRPRIATSVEGFSPVAAEGLAEDVERPRLADRSEFAPWGVVGIDHEGEANNTAWRTNVVAVETLPDRVIVGGKFTGVQNGPGAPVTDQSFLAAFDLEGNWISTFRPTLSGRVFDIEPLPDGSILVGGDFADVNGVADTSYLAKLDPTTGAVDETWRASVSHTDNTGAVRALDVRGDWIYAAGRFNRFKPGGATEGAPVSSAISIGVSDGRRGTWAPIIHGAGVDVEVSGDGTRVYLAGHFNAVNGNTDHGFHAITDIGTGQPVEGVGPFIPGDGVIEAFRYQGGVAETPSGKPVVGGSQHALQLYDRNRTALLQSHITKSGGDFQATAVFDGFVYASCHCMDWDYQGTNGMQHVYGHTTVNPIRMIARYDAETLEHDETWWPNGTKGENDGGIWAIDQDVNGCLWVGGDLIRGGYTGNAAADYLGGFARFCPDDRVAPTAPAALTAAASDAGVALAWSASTDAEGPVVYDVYRNDRVVATVTGTSYTDTSLAGRPTTNVRYTVRAADGRGNRSATARPVTVATAAPVLAEPVAFGSTWTYHATGELPGAGWNAVGFDDATWSSGAGGFGWGDPFAVTQTSAATPKPLATYLRTEFDGADLPAHEVASVDVVAHAGAVVYLNGTEIGRVNMPAGTVGPTTYALPARPAADRKVPTRFLVPADLLTEGTNVLAVELHLNYRSQPSAYADASLTLR